MAKDELRPDIQAAADRVRGKLGSGREIRKLVDHLWEGETVAALAPGQYGGGQGLLAQTDRRLLFIRDGIGSHMSEDFPFDRITSVVWSSGMLTGTITIMAGGARAEIKNIVKDAGKAIADSARNRISGGAGPSAEPAGAAAPSMIEQLTHLGEMHASGVLDAAEFAAAKAQLLR